ncbi:hypothetical protein [Methylotuvimicrobium sp. KM1]|uniref:hypothetical protein n=1 Tax=Methylotuvimicrobium sp. KM1 TaxID=3377707 RepID=UPI0038506D90
MKTLYVIMAIMLIVTSCRAGADIFIVQRIVIDEKALFRLLSKPRPTAKISIRKEYDNCRLGDRIAWAYLINHSVNTTK